MISSNTQKSGLTLVELIVGLLLASILAGVAVPRFFSTSQFKTRLFYDQMLSNIRYAQKLSVASGCRTRLNINDNFMNPGDPQDTYDITWQSAPCTTAATNALPTLIEDGGNFTAIQAPVGVDITPANINPFEFHSQGWIIDPADPQFNPADDDDEAIRDPNTKGERLSITIGGGPNAKTWLIRVEGDSGLAWTP